MVTTYCLLCGVPAEAAPWPMPDFCDRCYDDLAEAELAELRAKLADLLSQPHRGPWDGLAPTGTDAS